MIAPLSFNSKTLAGIAALLALVGVVGIATIHARRSELLVDYFPVQVSVWSARPRVAESCEGGQHPKEADPLCRGSVRGILQGQLPEVHARTWTEGVSLGPVLLSPQPGS